MIAALRMLLFFLLSFALFHFPAWAEVANAPQLRCPGGDTMAVAQNTPFKDALDTATKLGGIVGGIWALVIFVRDRRAKTIDTMISLEQEFRQHAAFLLKIETEYECIEEVLKREAKNDHSNNQDEDTLKNLDAALRHFVVCLQARNTGVIRKKVADNLYGYYLRMLANRKDDGADEIDRSQLTAYVERYWSSVGEWAAQVPPRGGTKLVGMGDVLKGAFRS